VLAAHETMAKFLVFLLLSGVSNAIGSYSGHDLEAIFEKIEARVEAVLRDELVLVKDAVDEMKKLVDTIATEAKDAIIASQAIEAKVDNITAHMPTAAGSGSVIVVACAEITNVYGAFASTPTRRLLDGVGGARLSQHGRVVAEK